MYNLFTKFPVIYYNDNPIVNILAKVKFNELAKKTKAIYYPYTIAEGERPDVIATNYYDDPRYSWLIYMANDIVDPLYDWPMTNEELDKFIIKKYQSLEKAKEKILFWRVNYVEDETILTPAGYEALPSYAKKYFTPRFGATESIVAYERSLLELMVDTNKIQQLAVVSTTGFVVEENIVQRTSGSITATAAIKRISNTTSIDVYNVVGAFANTGGSVGNIIKQAGSTNTSLSSTTTLATPIPANEAVYWTYVSAYDYENEVNEQKRHIKLIDSSYVDQIEKELDELL